MARSPDRLTVSGQLLYIWDDRRKLWLIRVERVSRGGRAEWLTTLEARTDAPLASDTLRLSAEAAVRALESVLPF